jgi:hypothetical protein
MKLFFHADKWNCMKKSIFWRTRGWTKSYCILKRKWRVTPNWWNYRVNITHVQWKSTQNGAIYSWISQLELNNLFHNKEGMMFTTMLLRLQLQYIMQHAGTMDILPKQSVWWNPIFIQRWCTLGGSSLIVARTTRGRRRWGMILLQVVRAHRNPTQGSPTILIT